MIGLKENLCQPHDMASVNNGKKWYIIGGAVSPGIFSIFSPTDVVEIYSQ